MVKVEFLGPIELDAMEVDIKTIDELSKFLKNLPAMEQWLDISAIAINSVVMTERKDVQICDNDLISILPPVCGG